MKYNVETSVAVKASAVTVLTAFSNNTVKSYQINESGALICISYGQESHFDHSLALVGNITELSSLVQQLSSTQNSILIRGTATPGLLAPIRRRDYNFPEHEDGCRWVMLDFDNLPLPEGMVPTSLEAIEHAIGKLPAEFQSASYFYQFSSSAGIIKPDGSPLKSGLNVHLGILVHRDRRFWPIVTGHSGAS